MNENKHPLAHALGDIDDRFLIEAKKDAPAALKAKRSVRKVAWRSVIAACLLLALILPTVLWLTPATPDGLSAYKDHPYFSVIKAIDAYEKLSDAFQKYNYYYNEGPKFETPDGVGAPGDVPEGTKPSTGNNSEYDDVTDNQVEGVFEGDRIKKTDTHVFFLEEDNVLSIYSLNKEASARIASFDPTPEKSYTGWSTREIYLTNGGKTLITVSIGYDYQNNTHKTRLSAFDVSNVEAFDAERNQTADLVLDGILRGSRLADGNLLLSVHYAPSDKPDFKTYNFIPHYETSEGRVPIAPEDITVDETPAKLVYTVLYLLDEGLAVKSSHAVMGSNAAEYVTKDTVYLVSDADELIEEITIDTLFGEKDCIKRAISNIVAISYQNGELVKKGSVTVNGSVKDQYSLDEYEGILRVATTTSQTRIAPNGDRYPTLTTATNASLFCISLKTFTVVASVENFAPTGESVKSVRFDGTSAYVCTAVGFTDPVYFFDLSDLQNITHTDTGVIEGFSTSLVELQNGYLLGIGYADRSTLKIEIYQKEGDSVVSVASYLRKNVYFSTDYKSYYINREDGYLGIGLWDDSPDKGASYYLLFTVKDNELTLKSEVFLEKAVLTPDYMRGFVQDGYLYVLAPLREGIRVVALEN